MSAPQQAAAVQEGSGGRSGGRFPRLAVLWSFAVPHRRALGLGFLLALGGSATALASPLVTKWVLDALATSGSLLQPVLVLAAMTVVGAGLSFGQWVVLGTVGEQIVLEARRSIVDRYVRARIGAITARPAGELVTRVTSDTLLLRQAASSSLIGIVNGLVVLVGSLILMGVLDLVLLSTTFVALSIVTVLFLVLMPGIARAQQQAQEHVGHLGGTLEGALRAVRTVKASRAEARIAARIGADADISAEFGIRAVRREAIAWTIAWGGLQVAIITILGLGAWRVSEGTMEVSSLIAFLLYAFGLMGPIMELTQNITALQSGFAAAERIREVEALEVEEHALVPAPARTGVDDGTGPILRLRGVTAAYGPDAAPAVSGVDLTIPRRGHVAVVGPSGAGKTTVMSLVLRFLEPQAGEILLDGVPYSALTHDDVRRRMAYVEQESPVVPGTIRENLTFSEPGTSDEDLHRVLAEVQLDGLVAELPDGLDTPLSATSVSGGQRQRIALARAILGAPELLLLDEATAQVDALTEAAIHRCIQDRAGRGAVLTIAHRLSTVVDADEIVVLDAGRVRARGTHAELLEADELYRGFIEALRIGVQPAPRT
ncbi:ABC transporter ATP-binding protein [Patulibacter americanus]|uniref:ABC transporter ATP-binding protein n=1 Tax=Patulibacter americanus TaxID=588672 RepID=UPI0003B75A47|nr:ABC transporter ATP-binding protein [Patulibacter americanus]